MKNSNLTDELIELQIEIKKHVEEFGLDCFEVIFELVDYSEINSIAALGGFPKRYPHWRFGMEYDQLAKGYSWGMQKIYELVINTDPCYAYLMRSNPYIDQKLVMAHVYGHCDFFKNNVWFSKTNRKMMDQMANHGVRVSRYMDRHGVEVVEDFIDCCLSLENLIDPYLPFVPAREESDDAGETVEKPDQSPKLKAPRNYLDSYMNPKEFVEQQKKQAEESEKQAKSFPAQPVRDVLGFLREHGQLEEWQADVLSIIRDEAYYFAPQRMTKIMNEGWASYWHSKIMTERALDFSEVVDFADRHAGVMVTSQTQLNPYKLGIELFRHIEDRWNKGKFGKEYDDCDDMKALKSWDRGTNQGREKIFAVRQHHNDVTFIDEFFTEEFCEEQKIYTYGLNPRTNKYEIKTRDWQQVKEQILTGITNGGQPIIRVTNGNFKNRGELLLEHDFQGVDLDINYGRATLENASKIWGRPVHLETQIEGQKRRWSYEEGKFREEKLG